jgi:hypothetical protein
MILFTAAVCALCAGRGLEHWSSGETLYLSFLQEEALFGSWLPELLGTSWEHYANSALLEAAGRALAQVAGLWLLLTALLLPLLPPRRARFALLPSAGILTLAAILVARQRFLVPELLEAGLQIGLPLALCLELSGRSAAARTLALVSVAACFAGHGLYAVGAYPVPGHFIDYFVDFIGLSEAQARHALLIAGSLDLLAAAALFWSPIRRPALLYCAAWGLATACARLTPAIWPLWMPSNLPPLVPMALWRLAHALGPLALAMSTSRSKTEATRSRRLRAAHAR